MRRVNATWIACAKNPFGFAATRLFGVLAAPTRVALNAAPSTPPIGGASSSNTTSPGAADDAAASALDVAMRVNKLKRLHQTGGNANTGKKQLEFTAWKELNTLNEQQINHAEGKAVALLLNSWAYFAKFWEKGKDGPLAAGESASQEEGSKKRN